MAAIEYFFNVNGYQPQTASLNIQSYERLRQEVANRFPLFDFKVSYYDEENDLISITNDKEFLEAQQQSANGLLVLTIEEVERHDIPEVEAPAPVVYASSVFEYDDNTSDSEDEDENPVIPLLEKACKYFDFDTVEDVKESGREVLDNIANELERAVNSEAVDDALDKASSVIELGLGIGKGFLEGLKKEYTKAKEAKSSVPQSAVHHAFCDNCHLQIVGVRYKCLSCDDYDLCSACHSSGRAHTKDHLFALLRNPTDEALLPKPAVPVVPVAKVPEPVVPSYAHLKVFIDMGFAQSDLPRIDALMKQYNNDVPSVLERLL